jgi:hypothetical protein
VDLCSLVVANVPASAGDYALLKATEMLLRSGGFGLMVVDLTRATLRAADVAWQGRILSLARDHQSRVLLLTTKHRGQGSLGPLIGLRIAAHKERLGQFEFGIHYEVMKDKSGLLQSVEEESVRGPWGLY